jgi:hypothetical protein
MNYSILTDAFDFKGKKKGDAVTKKELQDAGLNIEALVAAGHLSGNTAAKTVEQEGAKD